MEPYLTYLNKKENKTHIELIHVAKVRSEFNSCNLDISCMSNKFIDLDLCYSNGGSRVNFRF